MLRNRLNQLPRVLLAAGLMLNFLSAAYATDPKISELQNRIKQLESENKALKEQVKKQSASAPQSSGTESAAKVNRDIAGVFGEKEIRALGQLGVFRLDPKSFGPQEPITRGEFAAWLVRANNIINKPNPTDNFVVRLAEAGSKATFSDVAANNPYFRYIQGLANAGYSVGYTDGTFKPEKPISREEMIHLKTLLDWGEIPFYKDVPPESILKNMNYVHLEDRDKIDQRYLNAFMGDMDYSLAKNTERAFGSVRVLRPKELATKAEAAVMLYQFGGHRNGARRLASADTLLKKK